MTSLNNKIKPDEPTVTILGSGTCTPSLERSACSLLVEAGMEKIVFDMGAGTMRRLLASGVTVFDVTHVFISHFHPDHTGELASFLFASKYAPVGTRTRPLALVGGEGFNAFFMRLQGVYGSWIQLDGEMGASVVEFSKAPVRADCFHVDAEKMMHRPESLAYRLTFSDGRVVVYSGDTDYTEALVTVSQNADILVCDCAKPDESKAPGHLTPSLAGDIAARADVGTLVLTHFYPECDQVDIAGQCRRTYNGPLLLAEDGMRIPFPPRPRNAQ